MEREIEEVSNVWARGQHDWKAVWGGGGFKT